MAKDTKDTKITTHTRSLRCKLTDKEVGERAQRAASLLSRRDDLEAQLKAENSLRKADIKEIDAELRRVSTQVRERSEHRDVVCESLHDYRRGVIQTRRTDTGEEIAERPMTPAERQPGLPFDNEKPETPDAKKPETPKNGKASPAKIAADNAAKALAGKPAAKKTPKKKAAKKPAAAKATAEA